MKNDETELENKIMILVQQKGKAKISWLAAIVQLPEDEIRRCAIKLKLVIKDEYLISLEENTLRSKDLSPEEYEKLYPKPAPTFCEAKKSKY